MVLLKLCVLFLPMIGFFSFLILLYWRGSRRCDFWCLLMDGNSILYAVSINGN